MRATTLAVACVGVLSLPRVAEACSCEGPAHLSVELAAADVVAEVEVISLEWIDDPEFGGAPHDRAYVSTTQVRRLWKGRAWTQRSDEHTTVRFWGNTARVMCGFDPAEVGQRALVFLRHSRSRGRLEVPACSFSVAYEAGIARVAQALDAGPSPPPPPPGCASCTSAAGGSPAWLAGLGLIGMHMRSRRANRRS